MAVMTALLATAAAVWYMRAGERSEPETAVLPPLSPETTLVMYASSPRQLTQGDYEYPVTLWDAGVEGEVMLRVLVSAKGGVDSVLVEQSSGYAEFDSVAVQGTRALRFEPATPEEQWVMLPVRFDLDAYR